eukprot:s145_g8.t1
MSSSEVRALQAEVESLRSGLEALWLTVNGLAEIIEAGEASGHPVIDRASDRASVASGRASAVSAVEGGAASRLSSGYSVVGSEISTDSVVQPSDKEGRAELACQIGRFIRRSLAGEYTGSSGRDRLQLRNRVYAIFADY